MPKNHRILKQRFSIFLFRNFVLTSNVMRNSFLHFRYFLKGNKIHIISFLSFLNFDAKITNIWKLTGRSCAYFLLLNADEILESGFYFNVCVFLMSIERTGFSAFDRTHHFNENGQLVTTIISNILSAERRRTDNYHSVTEPFVHAPLRFNDIIIIWRQSMR